MTRPLFVLIAASALVSTGVACDSDPSDPLDAGRVDAGSVDSGPERDAPASDVAAEDAAGEDARGEDAGETSAVNVFVAQGHVGRTTVSCDGGRTWVANRSLDDDAVCWPAEGEYDCDHHPGAAKGIAFAPTPTGPRFVATWGWGPPGGIDWTAEGTSWTRTLADTTFGDVVFGGGVVLAAARNVRRSTDFGDTWVEGGESMLSVFNVRRAGFGDGRFVMVGEDGGMRDVVLSDDLGVSWRHAESMPSACGASVQTRGGIVAGGGTTLILGGDGVACASTDGQTFVESSIGTEVSSQLVWNGTEFVAWSRGQVHRSADGVTWNSSDMSPGGITLGAVAYGDGSYVGVRGGWQVWYEDQVFYRSSDGTNWAEADAFVGSHPIRFMAYGQAARCP